MYSHQRLIESNRWFIRLRWLFIGAISLGTYIFSSVFPVLQRSIAIYSLAFSLVLLNIFYLRYLKELRIQQDAGLLLRQLRNFIHVQIGLDLLILTAIIHFSGGADNAIHYFFIFHVLLAGIILGRKESLFYATLAVFLYGGLITLEHLGVIPHCSLVGVAFGELHLDYFYMLSDFFVFLWRRKS